jgi:hypothetical protein
MDSSASQERCIQGSERLYQPLAIFDASMQLFQRRNCADRMNFAALPDRRHDLPRPGLAIDTSFRKTWSRLAGHPVDVSLTACARHHPGPSLANVTGLRKSS